MSSQVGFISPEFLWALISLPVVVLFLRFTRKLKGARLGALGLSMPSDARVLASSLIVLALILSLARPYWGYQDVKVQNAGRDLMLIVDVSKSMLTRDQSPNRLEFSRRKMLDLVNLIKTNSPGDRVGIILFAGEAYLYCPLTSDYAALTTFINSTSTELITRGGSALRQALELAAHSFSRTSAETPSLLILSDGEEIDFNARSVLEALPISAPISALGFGTPEGKPIEYQPGRFLRNNEGELIISKLVERNLKDLAEETRGVYRPASLDDSDLLAVLSLGSQNRTITAPKDSQSVRVYNELGPLILWLPLFYLTYSIATRRGILSLTALFLMFPSGDAHAEPETTQNSAYAAYQSFAREDYANAATGFAEALETEPDNSGLHHALGSALYRLEKFPEAAEAFSRAAELATNGRLKFEALYNLGNSQFKSNDFKSAIESYNQALEIKPEDEKTLDNLDLAKRMLEQAPPPTPTPQSNKNSEDTKPEKGKPEPGQDKEPSDQSGEAQNQDDNKNPAESKPDKNSDTESQSPAKDKAPNSKETEENNDSKSEGPESPKDKPTSDAEADSDQNETSNPSSEPDEKDGQSQSNRPQHDPKQLKEREARAWLESLSDSPILLRRKLGAPQDPNEQSW